MLTAHGLRQQSATRVSSPRQQTKAPYPPRLITVFEVSQRRFLNVAGVNIIATSG